MDAGATQPAETKHERIDQDVYLTPDPLALAICQRVATEVGGFDVIVEPSAGRGAFVRAARATWPGALIEAVEINPAFEPDIVAAGADSVVIGPWEGWSQTVEPSTRVLIVGNPPYSLADPHVRLALERMAAWGGSDKWMSLLMRGTYLAGVNRYATLYGPDGIGGLRYGNHVVPRPQFVHDSSEKGLEYAELRFESGYRGPYVGGWLRWDKPSRRRKNGA